jgi:hypothetical protein
MGLLMNAVVQIPAQGWDLTTRTFRFARVTVV